MIIITEPGNIVIISHQYAFIFLSFENNLCLIEVYFYLFKGCSIIIQYMYLRHNDVHFQKLESGPKQTKDIVYQL